MGEMTEIFIKFIGVILYAVMGGYFISLAIDHFKKNRPILVGINIMLAFYEMVWLARLIWKW